MPVLASDILNPYLFLAENQFEPTFNHIPFTPPPQLSPPPPTNNPAFPPQLNPAVPDHGGSPGTQDVNDGHDNDDCGGDSGSDSDSDLDIPINLNEAIHPPHTPIDEAELERELIALHTLGTPTFLFQNSASFSWRDLWDRLAQHEFTHDIDIPYSFPSSTPASGVPTPSSMKVNCRSSGGTSMSASVVLSTRSPSPGATAIAFAGGVQIRGPEMVQGQGVFLWLVPAVQLPRLGGGRG